MLFLKLVDNNDTSNFIIIPSKMKSYKTKISMLKSQYKNRKTNKDNKIYNIFDQLDYSFSVVYKTNQDLDKEGINDKIYELNTFYLAKQLKI